MDLKDMILVTENDRGTETNMLMTLDDYKSFIAVDDMSELADNLLQLGRTLGEADKQSCMEWSLTAYQEESQSSFIRMPISVLQDLRIPHIRITFLMWLSEMCHLEIIRYLIRSTTSITSVSTIISLQKHLTR